MNTDTPKPPPSKQEIAIGLMAEYSTTRATLNEALAPFQSQVALLNAELAKAAAPYNEKLENIKAQAEALGLENAADIFGEHRSSLPSNGLVLKLSESEAVNCPDIDLTTKRLLREAGKAHLIIAPEDAEKTKGDRMAAAACLRIKVEVNKAYVQSQYDDYREWFNERGIFLEPTISVNLTDAPKARVSKTKGLKAPKKGLEAVVETQPEDIAA